MIKKILGVALALSVVFGITYAANDGRMKDRTFEEVRDTVCNDEYTLEIHGRFVEDDTLFFLKEYVTEKGSKQLNTSAYLEPDRNSLYYMPEYWLSRFDGIDGDAVQQDMRYWTNYRQEHNGKSLGKVRLPDIPADWIPLYHVDGKTCVFVPCEVDRQYRLTDSLLMWKGFEISFFAMRKSECLSPACQHFQVEELEGTFSDLYIHRVDNDTDASVWEFRYGDSSSEYILMIPVASVKDFDMVVCQTVGDKYFGDWGLCTVDAERILEAARRGEKIDIHHLDKFVVRRS